MRGIRLHGTMWRYCEKAFFLTYHYGGWVGGRSNVSWGWVVFVLCLFFWGDFDFGLLMKAVCNFISFGMNSNAFISRMWI